MNTKGKKPGRRAHWKTLHPLHFEGSAHQLQQYLNMVNYTTLYSWRDRDSYILVLVHLLKQQSFDDLVYLTPLLKNLTQLDFLAFHPCLQELGFQTTLGSLWVFSAPFHPSSHMWIPCLR